MPGPTPLPLRRLWFGAVSLALVAGCSKEATPPPAQGAPAEVAVADVVQRDEPVVQEWIGTLDGYVNAEIRAQVTGYLLRQDYVEGHPVKKGDLLFEIDPRPFRAVYDRLQANFQKTELDLRRESELIKTQAVAQEDYDNALQARLAAQAALEEAKLNLEFSRITAPVDGIAGIATGQIGDLVGPSSGTLATVSQVDPIKVYFPISEQTYLDLFMKRPGNPHFLENIQWELILADGSVYPLKGKFFAADREVNVGTGTLRVAAIFPNPEFLLRPGQYGRVRAVIEVRHGALLVPQRAVSELQGAYQVVTVDRANRAHLRNVTVGQRVGSSWIIESGLRADDRVVADGVQKLHEGSPVNPHRFVPPAGGEGGGK